MAKFCVVALVLVGVVAVALAEDKYTTKYDNVDLDEILQNKRLLKNYVNCLLEKGNCTPDGQELKSKFCLMKFPNDQSNTFFFCRSIT